MGLIHMGNSESYLSTPEVFEARWWACMYGAPTAKRSVGWSNCRTVKLLDLGRMVKKIHNQKGGIKSTKTYRNRRGKKSFSGSKFLKSTGPLVQFRPMLFDSFVLVLMLSLLLFYLLGVVPYVSTEHVTNTSGWVR